MADQISMQLPLAQQLNDMVKNFTLLDILSKEEQEDILSSKIDLIKKQNEERLKRHQEIEEDKLQATGGVGSIKPVNKEKEEKSTSPQTSRSQWQSSPVEQRREWNAPLPHDGHPRTPPNGNLSPPDRTRSPPDRTRSPHGMPKENEYIHIQLNNEGRGLGFGLVGQRGRGVVVKTIVPQGAAAMDGRLQPGDMMISVNDISVRGFTRDEIVDLLIKEQKRSPKVTLQVMRGGQPISSSNQVGNVYGRNVNKEMEFTVKNELCTKDEGFPRRRVSEDVCGKDVIVTLEHCQNSSNGHMTRVTEIKEHKTLNVEVDLKGKQERRRADKRVPDNPAQASPREEWTEKRKQNIDRVEAEIQAMREQYENQKQQDAAVLPAYGGNSFLDDPSRRNPSQDSSPPDRPSKQHGSRRSQHSYGGADFEDATSLVARQSKEHSKYHAPRNIDISMTGKERKRYENWKKERDVIDEERLARHKNAAGEWKREWDKEKPGKRDNSQNERQSKTPSKGRAVLSGNDTEDLPPQSWGRNDTEVPPPQSWGRNDTEVPPPQSWGRNDTEVLPPQSWGRNDTEVPPSQSWGRNDTEEPPPQSWGQNDTEEPPPQSWGRGRGRGRGIPKKEQQINSELKYSKILSASKKKMDESKKKMDESKFEMSKTTDNLPASVHSADDGLNIPAVLSTGSDQKERQPKSNLHINIPDPAESATITSPDTFKTPLGFKPVIDWAEEMERVDPENNL